MIEKPKLYLNTKEFWLVFILFLSLLGGRLFFIYEEYIDFVNKPFYFTNVTVLKQYMKNKNIILKVHSKGLGIDFFTRIYIKENLIDRDVRLKLFPSKKITFIGYLGTSFIPSKINSISEERKKSFKSILLEAVKSQHHNSIISEFYQAIFFATPISKELREKTSILGINHLIALSGLHLTILSSVLFLIFSPPYRLLQQKYFPYRLTLMDVGFLVLVVLGFYIYLVDLPPSLVRSYFMMVVGWITAILGIELLSYYFLVTIMMIIILLFPSMMVSISFWLSVIGVFYIILLVENLKIDNKIAMFIIVPFGLFILMFPIIRILFPITTTLQLFSPILSLLFTIFYPLSILSHILNIGDYLDGLLLKMFMIKTASLEIRTGVDLAIGYIILSVSATKYRPLFFLLLSIAIIFMLFSIF